ncbi:hypothetical protein HCN44_011504 [Aphidius gifuensis]|uniref:Uncharacterized protein n=1 Tax=Aphidius gifuensis TaxID=684658 RepID=A0A835CU87_APHGI|nr:hypothetical protein HCN44_011504 [Aphidius gifuensis]
MSVSRVLQKYQLVEWKNRGPKPKKRSIDIVPQSWLSSEKKSGKKTISCFFPPSPYNDLETLVRSLALPNNEGWTKYSVAIVGEADTYDDALEHYKNLENGDDYGFSHGSDNTQSQRAQELEETLHQSQLRDKEAIILSKQKDLAEAQNTRNKTKRGTSSAGNKKIDQILKLVKSIDKKYDEIKNNPKNMSLVLEEIHDIKLPIESMKSLVLLENKLNDKNCYQDTFQYMMELTEDDKSLPDCGRSILKAFMARDIAMQLTVTRHRDKKYSMADNLPILRKCMEDSMNRKRQKLRIKTKSLVVLGDCLTRSSDWDNHRKKKSSRPSIQAKKKSCSSC